MPTCLVLAICQKIVAAALKSDRGNRHGRLARVDETLVKIALTLHRRTETREEALTLFEDLQELEARGVDDYLNSGSDDL